MADLLLSMGLDVGTSTTQMVISRLTIENRASGFSVPEIEITGREVLYKSPVYFTPLISESLVDENKIRALVEQEYAAAGIPREQIQTGAVIITGESSRKENAKTVLSALSESSGEFVVATAGPHLESVLAAKGAGADLYSEETDTIVLHIDIGGGTSNLALVKSGQIVATGCLNVGGRLLKFDESGYVKYCSPVLKHRDAFAVGQKPSQEELANLCQTMVHALEMAAGLRPPTNLLHEFWTEEAGNPWLPPPKVDAISLSGGVAACIEANFPAMKFGDLGPLLAEAICRSQLWQMPHRLAPDAIRATVIGAGCHSAQLSGSTVFYRGVELPLKNLPVVSSFEALASAEEPLVLVVPSINSMHYAQITALAEKIVAHWPALPIIVAMELDLAKALGHALALRLPSDRGILCIDRVRLPEGSFLDVGQPVGSALPVVIKTLIFEG